MTASEKAARLVLELVRADSMQLVRKVESMEARMKVLETWQATMDMILKRM